MLRKEYLYQYNKKWREKNKNYYRPYAKEYARRIRREVIEHYGSKCVCCGETTYEFLSFDHINGKGKEHRKITGTSLALWLKRNNYPKTIQILCHNCNQAKGWWGICPHKKI